MREFTKLSEAEFSPKPSEATNIFIEENGVVKRAPKNAVGGAGSWNDLKDKPFYENKTVAQNILENYELAAGNNVLETVNPHNVPTVETDFKVVINGEEYYTTLRNLGGTPPVFVLGNPAMYNEDNVDTGLSFVIVVDRKAGKVTMNTLDDSVARTVSIYMMNVQVHQLDEKFIPDTIARVSDIPDVSGSGEPCSWNDLTDKPFYEKIVRNNVIISQKTFTHRGLDVNNVSDRIQSECDKPEEGDEIEVIFDGMHYHCTVERYTGSNFNHMTYIGNMRICYNSDTFEDNGMPFAVKFNHVTSGETSWNDIFVIDEESEHTIEAFVGSYELKQIESKYVVGFANLKPGQALVAKTVNSDGTPAEFAGADVFSGSWNDLSDRPCYDNIVIGEEVIENQEVPAGSSNVTVKSEYINDNPYAFPATDCIVYYDGVEYVCKVLVDGPALIYGNPAMDTNKYSGVEHPNNGLPFAMTYNRSNRKCTLYSMDTTVSHTISAQFAQIEFKQLDEKFIPESIARTADVPKISTEDWVFTLEDGSTVTKKVAVMTE